MKMTVSEYDFIEAFRRHDRDRSWSMAGLKAMYEFLCELDDSCGVESELDPIAVDCDFAEYESMEEYIRDYGDADGKVTTLEELEDSGETSIIRIPNTPHFIAQSR